TVDTIRVTDVDAGNIPLLVALAVNHGSLALNSTEGLTMVDEDGSDGTLSFTGSQAAINAALALGVIDTPAPDFNGTDTLTVAVNDELAGDTAILDIHVTPVNDAPVAVADNNEGDPVT